MISGTIFDIKKFAIHDGPGIRTTVFFKGCPLQCRWCHNPESRNRTIETLCVRRRNGSAATKSKEEVFGSIVDVVTVMGDIEKDRIFYEQSGGGVTFSGGEPMLQIEFLETLLKTCRAADIRIAVDTSGFVPFESFERIIDFTDVFLYDLKLIDDDAHQKYVGVSNHLILDNLAKLSTRHCDIVVRLPLIPGITDTEENINDTVAQVVSMNGIKKVSLLPYNPLAEDKMNRFGFENTIGTLPRQTKEELAAIERQFSRKGFQVSVEG